MIVTDIMRKDRWGKPMKGFYMDGYLMENLSGIPNFVDKGWDVVGIVTGHGKVRIGKSSLAFQIGQYCAWMLAGGKMVTHRDHETNKLMIDNMILPKEEVRFTLKENIVFKPEDLVEAATKLHDKYGKHQTIVYDEGREGLDSRMMDAVHEIMEDFFQKCGYMGHVIIVVLPNYFKLHEDYAVSRSLFLVDCLTNKKKQRGFFNFYDEVQKEWLYFLGKKRIGITQKYGAANESFSGRFSAWIPFDREEYDALKQKSLKRKSLGKTAKRWKKQRDYAIWILKQETGWDNQTIANKLTEMCGFKTDKGGVQYIISAIEEKREKDLDMSE
jgi:hypothetical protein